MKAIVDQDTCISCGLCIATCPEVFEFNDDGKSYVIAEVIPEDSEESAKEARSGCPVQAIDIKE